MSHDRLFRFVTTSLNAYVQAQPHFTYRRRHSTVGARTQRLHGSRPHRALMALALAKLQTPAARGASTLMCVYDMQVLWRRLQPLQPPLNHDCLFSSMLSELGRDGRPRSKVLVAFAVLFPFLYEASWSISVAGGLLSGVLTRPGPFEQQRRSPGTMPGTP